MPDALKNSTDLDIDKGTIRWLFTKRDKSSNAFAAAVAHVQRGGRLVIASRTDAETIKMMGDICEVGDIQSGRFLVEEGDYLIEEESTGRLHKQLSAACVSQGLAPSSVFAARQLNAEPGNESFRSRWCTTCCYKPATAVMHFQELSAEGTDAYLHWTPPPKPPPPPQMAPWPARGIKTGFGRSGPVKREPGSAASSAALMALPAPSARSRGAKTKDAHPARRLSAKLPTSAFRVKSERAEGSATGIVVAKDRKRLSARQAEQELNQDMAKIFGERGKAAHGKQSQARPSAKRRYSASTGAQRSNGRLPGVKKETVVKKERTDDR